MTDRVVRNVFAIFHTAMVRHSLFVLKVPLNSKHQSNNQLTAIHVVL